MDTQNRYTQEALIAERDIKNRMWMKNDSLKWSQNQRTVNWMMRIKHVTGLKTMLIVLKQQKNF